jgi:predicted amidohydrolase
VTEVVLGAVSMHCCHDKAANLEKYEAFIEDAGRHGVRLLVFPELSVQGHLTRMGTYTSPETLAQLDFYRREAEPVPGPTTERFGRLARQFDMTIQVGMAERSPSGVQLYNSAVVIGPDGGVIGVYRKVHNQNEWPVFDAGDGFPVFDTPVGRIGPFICADLHYPECTRTLVVRGAQVLTMSSAYPQDGDDPLNDPNRRAWQVQADAVAMASQVWLVQANQVGRPAAEGADTYFGYSRIVSPFGEVAAGGADEGLVCARVDLMGEIARHERLKGPRLRRRRPDLYAALSDPTP